VLRTPPPRSRASGPTPRSVRLFLRKFRLLGHEFLCHGYLLCREHQQQRDELDVVVDLARGRGHDRHRRRADAGDDDLAMRVVTSRGRMP
jgi:hypothetical protein